MIHRQFFWSSLLALVAACSADGASNAQADRDDVGTGDAVADATLDGAPDAPTADAPEAAIEPESGDTTDAEVSPPCPAAPQQGSTHYASTHYASEVVSFSPGSNAGFGEDDLPQVVLGPPEVGPPSSGAQDVLSLGVGGEIVLGFGGRQVLDGPGVDLIIWENPFWVGGNPEQPFAELGEVAVSEDGVTWHEFPCDPELEDGFDPGCAGWRPRREFDVCAPLVPEEAGGDTYDLADLGLAAIRYVRIRDLAAGGAPPSAGFDLDAVGAVTVDEP